MLVTTRTPLRASFVGGGTDLPSFYRAHGGGVVSTALPLYIDVSVRRRARIVRPRYRISCAGYEEVDRREDISHAIVREALTMLDIDESLDIISHSDVPAGTGLGSSSSFAVGLIHALALARGRQLSPLELADAAFELEVKRLGQPIGRQDQTIAAVGGFCQLRFNIDESVEVEPIRTPAATREALERGALLFYLGGSRHARELLETLARPSAASNERLHAIADTRVRFAAALERGAALAELGAILDETWQLKRALAAGVAPPRVEAAYAAAMAAGAYGGKLLGAGGTGCLLVLAELARHGAIRAALADCEELRFRLGGPGSRVLLATEVGS